ISPGASLTVMMDCCHSGTGNRPAPAADADLATLPMSRSVDPPDEVRGAIELLEALRNLLGWRRKNRFKVVKTQENNVLLAACRDNQTSADAYIANDYHGAFTWYLAEALQATGGHLTYRQLAERIGNGGQGYAQQPQLECQPASFDRQVFAPTA
ncbi:MAG: caspase family protein, partial [Anaerolineae bacterium]